MRFTESEWERVTACAERAGRAGRAPRELAREALLHGSMTSVSKDRARADAELHGAGKVNEHECTNAAGECRAGGIVIGSNLPVLGHTDPKKWAQLMRQPLGLRDREVKQQIWQVSLALPPGERLTPRQWSEAAQVFVERLGVAEHPWVVVHHGSSKGGNDHIHIVLNRLNFEGELWAAKHDSREVQRAATHLEQRYGLSGAPRTRSISSPERTSKAEVVAGQRESTAEIGKPREQDARLMRVRSVTGIGQAKPAREAAAQKPNLGNSRPSQSPDNTPMRGIDIGVWVFTTVLRSERPPR